MANAIRRLSCISETIAQAIKEETLVKLDPRAAVQQELQDSALLFLERRKSSDSGVGSIQPDLYRKRGSIVDMPTSNATNQSAPIVAKVQLQLDYDFQKSDFIVSILNVTIEQPALPVDDCEIWLSLDSIPRHQTCHLRSGKLVRSETHKFGMSYDDLLDRQLIVELISTKNAGTTVVTHGRRALDLAALRPTDDLILRIDLIAVHEVKNKGGEIQICLQYLQSAQRLSLSVHQANGLRDVDGISSPAFSVRAVLSLDGKALKKRKTAAKKGSLCPVWAEVLTFEVDPRVVAKCRLELSVAESNTNKIVATLSLGENTGLGTKAWRDALRGVQQLPRWLPLVPPPPSP